jgi:phosphomevalonate kinase
MGDCAGVGIEPAEQTRLADATESLPGVLCSGVPGAGGVDAIFAIVLSATARSRVEQMWSQWGAGARSGSDSTSSDSVVCPLMLHAEGGVLAGVRSEASITWD